MKRNIFFTNLTKSMVRNIVRLPVIRVCLSVQIVLFMSFGLNAQKRQVVSMNFFSRTTDVILWNDVEYMCNYSPLSVFDNYQTIFNGDDSINYTVYPPSDKINPDAPVVIDKNYQAKWLIQNQRLYLNDVEFLYGDSISFNKLEIIGNNTTSFFKIANMADWFTGFIYLKRQPEAGESYCDCMYQCEDFFVLGFRNGWLVYEEKVNYIPLLLDDTDYKDLDEFKQNQSYSLFIPPSSSCWKSQNSDEFLYYFRGKTNDKFVWNDTTFLCSESPLSVFESYKDIYPKIPKYYISQILPFVYDKNYEARWTIINDSLYLYEVNPMTSMDIIVDLKPVEKLTGKKLIEHPSFDQKIIFADWYSGTLFIKNSDFDFPETVVGCTNNCKPCYKMIIENGKIKTMEQTILMTYKRN